MPWTEINDGDAIRPEAIKELTIACNERLQLLGFDPIDFPDFEGERKAETLWVIYGDIQWAIRLELLFGYGRSSAWEPGRGRFCRPDFSVWQSDLELLNDAGHDSWEAVRRGRRSSLTSSRLCDPRPWKVLQDVFDVMHHIRFTWGRFEEDRESSNKRGTSSDSLQESWDALLTSDTYSSNSRQLNYNSMHADPTEWPYYPRWNSSWTYPTTSRYFNMDLTWFGSTYPGTLQYLEFDTEYSGRWVHENRPVTFLVQPVAEEIVIDHEVDTDGFWETITHHWEDGQLSEFALGQSTPISLEFADPVPDLTPFDQSKFDLEGHFQGAYAQVRFRWRYLSSRIVVEYGIELDEHAFTYG